MTAWISPCSDPNWPITVDTSGTPFELTIRIEALRAAAHWRASEPSGSPEDVVASARVLEDYLRGPDQVQDTPAGPSTAPAIAALDAINTSDPERAHAQAEDILLALAPAAVRDAYTRVQARADWWASA